tara:strand:- start:104 stop:421 length:318 start_codon:yes stop_codon:yes gene_type:complete
MPSGAKARVKVKKLKSKHEKEKGTRRSVKCGFGTIYDAKTKKCRKMSYNEREEEIKGKAKGYTAGSYLGGKVGGVWGGIAGAAYGRYAGGKMAKKKMSGQAKRKK